MVGPIAKENHGPTMFHMATVRHKRWDPCLLYRTSLTKLIELKSRLSSIVQEVTCADAQRHAQ